MKSSSSDSSNYAKSDEERRIEAILLQREEERILQALDRRKAGDDFESFVRTIYPAYQVNWHHRVLLDTLDRFAKGEIKRLMVFMPPRHGKSFLVSEFLPAYILGINPDAQVMAASYAAQLAWSFSRKVRRHMKSKAYRQTFAGVRAAAKKRSDELDGYIANKEEFEVVGHEGGYKCAGVGGGITGRGFHFGIIDDPIKRRQDAESPVMRQAVHDWYDSDFWTRQEGDEAAICLTMTRWHEDDLAGRLLDEAAKGGESWDVLWFPARREEEPPDFLADNPGVNLLGQEADEREVDEGLWLDKFSQEWYDNLPKRNERDFLSLYQNRPRPDEGNIFKRYMLNPCTRLSAESADVPAFELPTGHIIPADECVKFTCVDLATSEKTAADFTAIGAFYGHPGTRSLLLVDLYHERMQGGVHSGAIENVRITNQCSYNAIEKQFIGLGLIQSMRRAGKPVREVDCGVKDKFARAYSVLDFFEGCTFFIDSALPKRAIAMGELLSFAPGCAHDDIVDICVHAATHWKEMSFSVPDVTPSRPPDTLDDDRERLMRAVRPPRPR